MTNGRLPPCAETLASLMLAVVIVSSCVSSTTPPPPPSPSPASTVEAPTAPTAPSAVDTDPVLSGVASTCQADGARACADALRELGPDPTRLSQALDAIEQVARRSCRGIQGTDCHLVDTLAYGGRRDVLVPVEFMASVATPEPFSACRASGGRACSEAGFVGLAGFDEEAAGSALETGCAAGDKALCWASFVLVSDGRVIDGEPTSNVPAMCAGGITDACDTMAWTKQPPPPFFDGKAPPADAIPIHHGRLVEALPAGEPLRLDERVLVRMLDGDRPGPLETTYLRLRVGSMAGDAIRFAGRHGRVVIWTPRLLDGGWEVRELHVLGVLSHPWVARFSPGSHLVPKTVSAAGL